MVDRHEVVGEGRLRDERVVDEFLPGLAEDTIVHVCLPNAEDLRDRVVAVEGDVRYDVEHRRLMHPVR